MFGETRAHSFALLTQLPGVHEEFIVCSMPVRCVADLRSLECETEQQLIASLQESEEGCDNITWKDGSGPNCLLVNANY